MIERLLFSLLLTALSRNVPAAEGRQFMLIAHCVAIDPGAIETADRAMPLGKPVYLSYAEFNTNFQARWMKMSNVDYLTTAPLAISTSESTGIDLAEKTYLTNRAAELFPIPTNKPGLYWRFGGPETVSNRVTTEFAYNFKYDDGSIMRKAHFKGTLAFVTNRVAVIRLPQVTESYSSARNILGVPVGKKMNTQTRQFFIAIELTNSVATE
jgi:hypothetical protein